MAPVQIHFFDLNRFDREALKALWPVSMFVRLRFVSMLGSRIQNQPVTATCKKTLPGEARVLFSEKIFSLEKKGGCA
jgi:hypothetical protein